MAKPKTIACDKCGHRMEDIPDKCPECGEAIRERMDPHVRERITEKLNRDIALNIIPLAFLGLLFIGDLLEIIIHLKYGFRCWGCYAGGSQNMYLVLGLAVVYPVFMLTALVHARNLTHLLITVSAIVIGASFIAFTYLNGCGRLFTSVHNQGPENLMIILAFNVAFILLYISMRWK